MKSAFIFILGLFWLLPFALHAQSNFRLHENGVTIVCDGASPGDTGVIFGETYTAVSETQLRQMVANDEDVSKVCTSLITDMNNIFSQQSSFAQDISSWDVSNVTNMSRMFFNANTFNADISLWDVSNVTDMSWMFYNANAFNADVGSWDVSNVTDMSGMFSGASAFNADISLWDVSNVTNMSGMFSSAIAFNANISLWDVSNVTKMTSMFNKANAFNTDIGSWDVSNVTDMSYMFFRASVFNADIGSWDVSNVTDMSWMFQFANSFNQDLSAWDVSNVTDMSGMFSGASAFNADIGSWDVSNVIFFLDMFNEASVFSQDLSGWCVDQINSPPTNFAASSGLSQNQLPQWGICPGKPEAITLNVPANNSQNVSITPTFLWEEDANAQSYQIQIYLGVSTTVYNDTVSTNGLTLARPLDDNTQYSWRVRGLNEEKVGNWSSIWNFKTELREVDVVQLTTPENGATDVLLSTQITWRQDPAASSYRMQLSMDNFASNLIDTTLADTSLTLTNLERATSYQWRVQASNTLGNSEWSAPWSFTTIPNPPASTTLIAPANSARRVDRAPVMNWQAAEGATAYRLEIATDSTFNFVLQSIDTDNTILQAPALAYNTTYYWRVASINAGGESDYSDVWSFFTQYALQNPVLASPVDSAVEVPTSIYLMWQPLDSITVYQLQVANDPDFGNIFLESEWSDNSATKQPASQQGRYLITAEARGLDYSSTYYWRVRAVGPNGEQSDWSEPWEFSTKAAPVTQAVSLASPANNTEDIAIPSTLSWQALEGAQSYELQFSDKADFTTRTTLEAIGQTQVSLTGQQLADTTTYYWRVRALVNEQLSQWSPVWRFRTGLRIPETPNWEPANEQQLGGNSVVLKWSPSERAQSYNVQLSTEPSFSNPSISESAITETEYRVSDLENNTTYYWRVQAANASGTSDWSTPRNFSTGSLTSVDEQLPNELRLDQNYPNPFNPVTQISYSLPQAGQVRLAVYNMSGQPIQELVNGTQSAGSYQVSFDAASLPSGMYLYRLETAGTVLTRKMMLIK